MNWTAEQLRDYENRCEAQSAKPEFAVRDESLAEEKREASHTGRVHVRVISRRKRLIDPDNLCAKYFIDCLRYAQIIQDDSADKITLEVSQEKVTSGNEETVIEISTLKI